MMKIRENVRYIGVNDHQSDLFEGQYRIPNGISYNSYVILDEKTAVMDTVDDHFTQEWLENLERELEGRTPDYLVIQHMEPDHSAGIPKFLEKYPQAVVVATAKAFDMMEQFFAIAFPNGKIEAQNGGDLDLGVHKLQFFHAPMVHWPEVMLTYEQSEKILFSADSFGKFGALDVDEPWEEEACRYYIGIVGKYGIQVQNVLKKAAGLDIAVICPLHGPVLQENLGYYLEKYDIWSSYMPEKKGVVIAYASIYGNTEKAALCLAEKLKQKGEEVTVHDLAREDTAQVIAHAFQYDRLVLASCTYNNHVFPFMHTFLHGLTERNFQNRRVALIENGSWAPMAAKVMRAAFEKSRGITFAETIVTVKSALNKTAIEEIEKLAEELTEK